MSRVLATYRQWKRTLPQPWTTYDRDSLTQNTKISEIQNDERKDLTEKKQIKNFQKI